MSRSPVVRGFITVHPRVCGDDELRPLDEARAYQELIDLEKLSPPMLAARLHLSAQHVRDRLRVLADQALADAVERQQISATAARDIMQLPEEAFLSFRARVLNGEAIQSSDVAAVRMQLSAAGIINPRRKTVRPKKQTSFVPTGATTELTGKSLMIGLPARNGLIAEDMALEIPTCIQSGIGLTCYPKCDQALCETSACQTVWA
jgi:hypothetical protein